jgi:DNA-directed RNA polymerase II subunit RPB2
MESVAWKVIDKYFQDNPYNLVAHHLDSYNSFFENDIKKVFAENNPLRFIEKITKDAESQAFELFIYMGGRDGQKVYYSKPILYDGEEKNELKYLYPNTARLRNMTYGINIYYDIVVDFVYYQDGEKKEHTLNLERVFLCKFPIMLHSNLCILKSLPDEVRYEMGECRLDRGGYFIVDGKEKALVSQEKFADNMMYVKKHNADSKYEYSAEIRSVSEDPSKPIRTSSVNLVSPAILHTNANIVVLVPNVKIPVPLFILMRALGIDSDKDIIAHCILDADENNQFVDLFRPSVHDAAGIFTQQSALHYIKEFTKRGTINGVLEILMDYFLPHVGTENLLDKAYFVGHMVYKMLRAYKKIDQPTDRDNFMYKRVELSGTLLYQLFRDYYLLFKKSIEQSIDTEFYFHDKEYKKAGNKQQTGREDASKSINSSYKQNFVSLVEDNHSTFFKPTIIEKGIRSAFKGNWGASEQTKKVGVIQDLNRLSNISAICHLRKFVLPLDPTAKVTGPRLLHPSQWGYIDPVDSPDGGNCGLHKHMAISTYVTSGTPSEPMIRWMRTKANMKLLSECNLETISAFTKIFVNGAWAGVLDNPVETMRLFVLYRRIGLLPVYNSISFRYNINELYIYTDGGRLTRPLFSIQNGRISYMDGMKGSSSSNSSNSSNSSHALQSIHSDKFTWRNVISGFKEKSVGSSSINIGSYYNLEDMYPSLTSKLSEVDTIDDIEKLFSGEKSVADYLDTSEESSQYIATTPEDMVKSKYYTHVEIHPSLILGVLGNSVIFPEQNPSTRNVFSCGQSKQAVSMYHTNFFNRMDKMGVVLNNGQIPLVKSRYLKHINKEEAPYGVNAIVAIMSYSGYNVEDAILINKGAVDRGLFRTTYYTMYEAREENAATSQDEVDMRFADVLKVPEVRGIKPNYDYDSLNEYGLIAEETVMDADSKKTVIGRVMTSDDITQPPTDASVFPKKGQLGTVDKSFMTDGEEGTRIAKVRIREERIPAIGDKMASRAGQKGTIGLLVPEKDMPYASDGTVPDLIINPHALPSRMTIGQLLESLIGKADASLGGFGDCTAFTMKGANTDVFGKVLVNNGYHSSGNQVMYSGFTGEQLTADIFVGPTYYMRLKHMVKDKINYRADGPNTQLTRQAVQGRANDGGLRIGEMERDGVMAHGASAFLNDSFMNRADEYHVAICNKTGAIAAYNKEKNIMLSPHSDGPLQFNTTLDGNINLENISHHGRSFSIVRVPYSFKLLLQELQIMNIHMKIITSENIDNLTSMSYSDNANKLLKNSDTLDKLYTRLREDINKASGNIIVTPPAPLRVARPEMNDDGLDESPMRMNSPGSPIEGPPSHLRNKSRSSASTASSASSASSGSSHSPIEGPPSHLRNKPSSGSSGSPRSPLEGPPPSHFRNKPSSSEHRDELSVHELHEDSFIDEAVENTDVPDIGKFTLGNEDDMIQQIDPGNENIAISDPNTQLQFDALPSKDKLKLMKVVANMESDKENASRNGDSDEPLPIQSMSPVSPVPSSLASPASAAASTASPASAASTASSALSASPASPASPASSASTASPASSASTASSASSGGGNKKTIRFDA